MTDPHSAHGLRLPDGLLPLGPQALIMGILNVTPDSFSDGGQHDTQESALTQCMKMKEQGADIIDVGGESTRPGAAEVSTQEELDRVCPTIAHLVASGLRLPISVDTYKAVVADQAIQHGATLINDVYGAQRDPEIADVAATYDAPFIAMHWDKHRDKDLDIIDEMKRYFAKTLDICTKAGVAPDQIILDPGFGFAKSLRENYLILSRLNELSSLGFPLLIGTSRKSMIGKLLQKEPHERLAGTLATNVIAYQNGGHIFRVHDVGPHRDALSVAHAALYGAPDLE